MLFSPSVDPDEVPKLEDAPGLLLRAVEAVHDAAARQPALEAAQDRHQVAGRVPAVQEQREVQLGGGLQLELEVTLL